MRRPNEDVIILLVIRIVLPPSLDTTTAIIVIIAVTPSTIVQVHDQRTTKTEPLLRTQEVPGAVQRFEYPFGQ
jgi:hypothetical protein